MAFIDLRRSAPGVLNALEHPGRYLVRESDLEPELLVLVQIHVFYRSGCAECARGYAREARRTGEDTQRLRSLASWRETKNELYTARERTALAWAEALLRASGEDEWETVRREVHMRFSERDLADLSLAVLSALARSRMAVAVGWLPAEAADPARQQPAPASADPWAPERERPARRAVPAR